MRNPAGKRRDGDKSSTKKRLPVSQLKPGMYVVALDRSWFKTPFLFHRKLIKDLAEIELFKLHGIREVVIDLARNADLSMSADVDGQAGDRAPGITRAAPDADKSGAKKTLPNFSASLAVQRLQPLVEELPEAQTIHQEALKQAQRIFDGVGSGAPVSGAEVKKIVTDLLNSIVRSPEASLLLAQMRRLQNDPFAHAVNVCVLSLVVATKENLDCDIWALGMGALLHDVGQTRLPGNLMRQTSPYTVQERRLMERHPILGAAILQQSGNAPELTQRIVAEHHERIDGTGYPYGLWGAQISLPSQLVAITDLYDTMLTGLNRRPLRPVEVLRQLYLEGGSGSLDRKLIEKVIGSLGLYPIGSLVELDMGERAVVIAANRTNPLKPMLRIVLSPDGTALANGSMVDLAENGSDAIQRRILRVLNPGAERIDVMAYLKPEVDFQG